MKKSSRSLGLPGQAVEQFLAETTDDAAWQAQLGQALESLRQCIPQKISPAETEEDVTRARIEVRHAHNGRGR